MSGRIRCGVIGAGSWAATNHLPILYDRDDVDLVVACRKGLPELQWLGDTFGFEHLTEDAAEVADHNLDAVIVASPASLHAEHVRLALEAGAHVLCEKPFTIEPSDAWELSRLADRLGLNLLLAFGWNYNPVVIAAREMLQDGTGIGEVEHVLVAMASGTRELLKTTRGVAHSSHGGQALPIAPDPSTWTDPAISGGGYAQAQLSHALAMALWLTEDRGSEVFAMMNKSGGPVDLHDSLSIRFRSGATCAVSGASGMPDVLVDPDEPSRGSHQMQIWLFGSRGQMIMDLQRDLLWRQLDGQATQVPMEKLSGVYDCEGPPNALIDLALGKPVENRSSGELGARSVEILHAAYLSDQRSEAVRIE